MLTLEVLLDSSVEQKHMIIAVAKIEKTCPLIILRSGKSYVVASISFPFFIVLLKIWLLINIKCITITSKVQQRLQLQYLHFVIHVSSIYHASQKQPRKLLK